MRSQQKKRSPVRKSPVKKSRKLAKKSRPSKGWKMMSPQKGRERNRLMQDCGSKCFLEPRSKGFPVCQANRTRTAKTSCKIQCSGLLSAYVRSREWKHSKTSQKALRLAKKLRCSWRK